MFATFPCQVSSIRYSRERKASLIPISNKFHGLKVKKVDLVPGVFFFHFENDNRIKIQLSIPISGIQYFNPDEKQSPSKNTCPKLHFCYKSKYSLLIL